MATNPTDIAFGFSETEYFDEQPIGSAVYPGLTKREYFAALAMQGLLASERAGDPESVRHPGNVADLAVDQADELIAALNNPNKGGRPHG